MSQAVMGTDILPNTSYLRPLAIQGRRSVDVNCIGGVLPLVAQARRLLLIDNLGI